MSHEQFTLHSARQFMENMVAEGLLARNVGLDVGPAEVVSGSFSKIMEIAEQGLPLARLLDASDMLFHAEGPGAAHGMPWIGALTWLLESVQTNIRKLSAAVLDLWGADGRALVRHLDLRVPGVVPGSLWVGVKLVAPQADLLPQDTALMERLGGHLGSLPALTRFVGDEGLRDGIEEVAPDPALRDAQLAALYRFAPTGRRGIHTLELSARGGARASLSQRERVVLHEAIARPNRALSKDGVFIGEVREADLDKTRIHLRNVPDVGTLRCVLPELPADKAAAILGKPARVQGRYLADAQGRPRLMFVERIEPHQVQGHIGG